MIYIQDIHNSLSAATLLSNSNVRSWGEMQKKGGEERRIEEAKTSLRDLLDN